MLGDAAVPNVLSVLVDVNDDLSLAKFWSCESVQLNSTSVSVSFEQLVELIVLLMCLVDTLQMYTVT